MKLIKFLPSILIFYLLSSGAINTFAVRAYPFPLEMVQPDGNKLLVKLSGDEFHHFHTSEDGYLIKRNTKGYFTYATIDAKGIISPTKYEAQNINKRKFSERRFLNKIDRTVQNKRLEIRPSSPSKVKKLATSEVIKKATPYIGEQNALVILVNFSDNSFTSSNPKQEFSDLLNQKNYNQNGGTGSARDYFMASSYGKFSPNFNVVGPYTLSQNKAFYGKNNSSGFDSLPANMVAEACELANLAGMDFTKYDINNDGKIDNVFIYYAGYNEAEGGSDNTIWPHRWTLNESNFTGNKTFDGKILDDYACTSELKGNTGTSMCGIGTFAHEFGHVLGLPDYYDTSGNQTNTLGWWSIMDYGAYANGGKTPPTYSSYDRFYLGYITPEQINVPSTFTLKPLSQADTIPTSTTKQTYLLSSISHNLNGSSPSPTEFFMIEYRKKTGWDSFLPAEGMLIWHIDYTPTAWNNNTVNNYTGGTQSYYSHMRVYLQPLTGSKITPGTAFTNGSFTPRIWAGAEINRDIFDITSYNDSMTFKTMSAKLYTAAGLTSFCTELGTPSKIQNMAITAVNLPGDLNITLDSNKYFEMKLSSSSTWSRSLNLTPTTYIVNEIINIRYNPLTPGTHTNKINIGGEGLTSVSYNLDGKSTDPLLPLIKTGEIVDNVRFPETKIFTSRYKTLSIEIPELRTDLEILINGIDSDCFSISNTSITINNHNGSTIYTIQLKFNPISAGNKNAVLNISNGVSSTERSIQIKGTCI